MRFFVLISTIDEGLLRVPSVLLPERKDVRYIVVWQQTQPQAVTPDNILTTRNDITLDIMPGRGLSRSRNRAMQVAVEELGDPLAEAVFILADDDERFLPDAFERLAAWYDRWPRMDIALLRARREDGTYLKPYPPSPVRFEACPRSYYPSSVEMTFRSRLYHAGLRFDERFGLGSERLAAGEEDVFLTDACRKGLVAVVLPEDLCATMGTTTGRDVLNVKSLRSKGAVYGYRYTPVRAFLRAWREALSLAWHHHRSVWPIFRNIWYGVKYIRS